MAEEIHVRTFDNSKYTAFHDHTIMKNKWNVFPDDHPFPEIACTWELKDPMDLRLPQMPVFEFHPTMARWIGEQDDLGKMIYHIDCKTALAVDLKYSFVKGYRGRYPALMQISHFKRDFQIDVLNLQECIETIRPIFTNKNIVKVMFGAKQILQQLQMQYKIFIVGLIDLQYLFEVFHNKKNVSLLEVLHHYIPNLDPEFNDDMYDWTLRPLTLGMTKHAQIKGNYIIRLWETIKIVEARQPQRLWDKVVAGCNDMAKEVVTLNTYASVDELLELNKYIVVPLNLFIKLHEWRDALARELDIPPQDLMLDIDLFQLCKHLPLTDRKRSFNDGKRIQNYITINQFNEPYIQHLISIIREYVDSQTAEAANQKSTENPSIVQHNFCLSPGSQQQSSAKKPKGKQKCDTCYSLEHFKWECPHEIESRNTEEFKALKKRNRTSYFQINNDCRLSRNHAKSQSSKLKLKHAPIKTYLP